MEKSKFGTVTKCEFTSEWINPLSKKIIYYHDVYLDSGLTGSCGTMEKNSARIKKGAFIEFTIDEKSKIKLIASSNDKTPMTPTEKKSAGIASGKRVSGQETFLGYAWSYAKDLIIAGKTMDDVDELNKVARFIYDEIGKMLKNE